MNHHRMGGLRQQQCSLCGSKSQKTQITVTGLRSQSGRTEALVLASPYLHASSGGCCHSLTRGHIT